LLVNILVPQIALAWPFSSYCNVNTLRAFTTADAACNFGQDAVLGGMESIMYDRQAGWLFANWLVARRRRCSLCSLQIFGGAHVRTCCAALVWRRRRAPDLHSGGRIEHGLC